MPGARALQAHEREQHRFRHERAMSQQHNPNTGRPCSQCVTQAGKGPLDSPHENLRLLSLRAFGIGPLGWRETIYQCEQCGSLILHSSSRRHVFPYWMLI
jgi:hypothetical protein